MKTRLQNRFTRVDIAALAAFAAVWLFYICIVRYGVCFPDEHFYVTVAQRFVQGDRPLVDEWHFSQFSCVFLCLPYRLYTALRGSTDGIILFLRGLFVLCNAVFYWFMYLRLRAYRWSALLASLLFCAYIPGGLFACNYYTMAIRLLMAACLLLFSEKQTVLTHAAAGVLLSCAVLYQPGLALVFAAYSVLVWTRFFLRRKGKRFAEEYALCLSVRTWRTLTLSVLACAAVFLTWLLARSGLRNILAGLPDLFTDPEFDFYVPGETFGFLSRAIKNAADVYGAACLVPALVILILSAAYACGAFRARREPARMVLFCLGAAVWMCSCIYPFRQRGSALTDSFFTMIPAPMLWFGLVCYLLCEKKDKRLFGFWIVGAVSSVCIDVFSNNDLSLGFPIAYIADLVFCTELVRELRAGPNARRTGAKPKTLRFAARHLSRLTGVCFALWFGFVVLSGNTVFPQHIILRTPIFSFPYVCQNGPDRSLHFPQEYGEYYAAKLADLDAIRQSHPKNLYVYGMSPEAYLYADLPVCAYSSWTWCKSSELQRHVRYWAAHPERYPACIYVPYHEANDPVGGENPSDARLLARIRESFDPLCAYTLSEGQGGCTLYVSHWFADTAAAEKEARH